MHIHIYMCIYVYIVLYSTRHIVLYGTVLYHIVLYSTLFVNTYARAYVQYYMVLRGTT